MGRATRGHPTLCHKSWLSTSPHQAPQVVLGRTRPRSPLYVDVSAAGHTPTAIYAQILAEYQTSEFEIVDIVFANMLTFTQYVDIDSYSYVDADADVV
jgi:hypothetical protein